MPLARRELERGDSSTPWELVFVDDNVRAPNLNGMRVMAYSEWMAQPGGSRHINIAVADGRVRERLAERCIHDGVSFFDIRADNIVVMDDVDIGVGAALSPFVTLTNNIRIGRHFHANLYSYVEHDCVIGDYVTFAPGVRCNGNVIVEDFAYVGSGAMLRQGRADAPLVIGRGAVVGMGAVVTRSVAPGVTVVGNPARELSSRPAGAALSSGA
jgi:sugar O-acyltransferase (sialic acid O-acetyltransferase NeuD family)